MSTDYPTYDDVDLLPVDDAPMWCDWCGRSVEHAEDRDAWVEIRHIDGPYLLCPDCAALAEADGQEQADKQVAG